MDHHLIKIGQSGIIFRKYRFNKYMYIPLTPKSARTANSGKMLIESHNVTHIMSLPHPAIAVLNLLDCLKRRRVENTGIHYRDIEIPG